MTFICEQNEWNCIACWFKMFDCTDMVTYSQVLTYVGQGTVSSLPTLSETDNIFSSPPLQSLYRWFSGLFFRLILLF